MKRALRVMTGLNAAFQLLVGLICVASPPVATGLFGMASGAPATLALTRMFGGLLAGSGILSAAVARDPDVPALRHVLVAGCVCNVGADVIVCGSGDMQFSQLALGMILQVVVVAVALAAPRGAGAR